MWKKQDSQKYTYQGNSFSDPEAQQLRMRDIVSQHMTIETILEYDAMMLTAEDRAILDRAESYIFISFTGRLTADPERVYNELDKELRNDDTFPLLRMNPDDDGKQPHLIHIAVHRPEKPAPLSIMPNVVLFIATVFSLLYAGAVIAIGEIGLSDPELADTLGASIPSVLGELWRGWPYALALLLILVPHEMGHYLMMRRHRTAASLPYFIPAFLISPFGTFGAAIALRESLRNRKVLLDVGASGPIAGFVFAVPILFIGLATSSVIPIQPDGYVEGNSLLYAFAKLIIFGEMLPNGEVDVMVNQLAWAGWTGLFVTALNMIPLGQLDGGHVLYALFGERARRLYWPLMGVMLVLFLFVSPVWLVFALMLMVVGRFYAVPLDTITPLDNRRRVVAVIALVIFMLSFTPVPLSQGGEWGGVLTGAIGLVVGVISLRRLIQIRFA